LALVSSLYFQFSALVIRAAMTLVSSALGSNGFYTCGFDDESPGNRVNG
jgi:hypothetical protein